MDARSFLENYVETDIEKDPLPIKVLRNAITTEEILGQAIHWGFEYLDQRSCPLPMINHILEKLFHVVRQTDFSHCAESADEALDVTDNTKRETQFEPLKLMRSIVKILDNICMKEREDFHDSVDGIVEAPDMQPHIFSVSYGNIKNTRRFMEDRMTILPRMDRIFNLPFPISYFAVFDGHNGAEAAAYGAAQLHQCMNQSLAHHQDVISSISDAFESVDEAFVEKCSSGKIKSGSTAVLSLIMPGKLYVAWLGDSQAVLVKQSEVSNLVTPHKPERKDEIDRIKSLGGEVIQMHDTYRVNGNLAVSRAIGDADQKTFIISTPDIKMLELDGSEEFLILACDGLWDEVSPEAAAHIVRRTVVADPSNIPAISQKLIHHAKTHGSQDNISVIVVFLEPLESLKNRYEGNLEAEIESEVALIKSSPEPIGVVPMDKFIEHGIDSNIQHLSEMNGHSKDSEQLVDFLSFGSSKESNAQHVGDEAANQSGDDDDLEKKEVELSDAESDDEWQFEKPSEQGLSITSNIISTGNGLSSNPFALETAALDGAPCNGAIPQLDTDAELSERPEIPVKERSSEMSVGDSCPFARDSTVTIMPSTEIPQLKENLSEELLVSRSEDEIGVHAVSSMELMSVTNSGDAIDPSEHGEFVERIVPDEVDDDEYPGATNSKTSLDDVSKEIKDNNPFNTDALGGGDVDASGIEAILSVSDQIANTGSETSIHGNPFGRFETVSETELVPHVTNIPISESMENFQGSNMSVATRDLFGLAERGDEYLAYIQTNPIPEEIDPSGQKQFLEDTITQAAEVAVTEPEGLLNPREPMYDPVEPIVSVDQSDDLANLVDLPKELQDNVIFGPTDPLESSDTKLSAPTQGDHPEATDVIEKFEQEDLIDDMSVGEKQEVTSQDQSTLGITNSIAVADELLVKEVDLESSPVETMGVTLNNEESVSSPDAAVGNTSKETDKSDVLSSGIVAETDYKVQLVDAADVQSPNIIDGETGEVKTLGSLEDLPSEDNHNLKDDAEGKSGNENIPITASGNEFDPCSVQIAEETDDLQNLSGDKPLDLPREEGVDRSTSVPIFEPCNVLDAKPGHTDITKAVSASVETEFPKEMQANKRVQERKIKVGPSPGVTDLTAEMKAQSESPTDGINEALFKPVETNDSLYRSCISTPAMAISDFVERPVDSNCNVVSYESSSTDSIEVPMAEKPEDQVTLSVPNESVPARTEPVPIGGVPELLTTNPATEVLEVKDQISGNEIQEVNNEVSANEVREVKDKVSANEVHEIKEELSGNEIPDLTRPTSENGANELPNANLGGEEIDVAPEKQSLVLELGNKPAESTTRTEVADKEVKIEDKAALKPAKSPTRPEAPAAKGRVALASTVKKSPVKPESVPGPKATSGTARPAAGMKAPTRTPVSAAPKPTSARPSPTTKPMPSKVASARPATASKPLNGVDSKPLASKPAAPSTARARPLTAPAPKPASKTASVSSVTSTASKRALPAGANAAPKPKPLTTSGSTKPADGPPKPAITQARATARPKPTTLGTATTKPNTSIEAKKAPAPRSVPSAAKVPAATPRAPISRTAPTSARMAPPKPSAVANKSSAPKPATKVASDTSKVGLGASKSNGRPTTAPATTAAKPGLPGRKAAPTSLKPSKPVSSILGTAASKGTKPTTISKTAVNGTNEKAELIQQNGLSNGGDETVKEMNAINGGMNGNHHEFNGETEKQDATKENGVHLDDQPIESTDSCNPPVPIET